MDFGIALPTAADSWRVVREADTDAVEETDVRGVSVPVPLTDADGESERCADAEIHPVVERVALDELVVREDTVAKALLDDDTLNVEQLDGESVPDAVEQIVDVVVMVRSLVGNSVARPDLDADGLREMVIVLVFVGEIETETDSHEDTLLEYVSELLADDELDGEDDALSDADGLTVTRALRLALDEKLGLALTRVDADGEGDCVGLAE